MYCFHCFRKNSLVPVSHIIENSFHGIEAVHEDYQYLLTKPNPVRLKLSIELAIKMSIWYSLIFTPFLGPLVTLITACICFFIKDKEKYNLDMEKWNQLTYCKGCRKIS